MCDFKKHRECSCTAKCVVDLGTFNSRAAEMNRRHRDIEAKVRKQTNAVVVTALLSLLLIFTAWVYIGAPAQHQADLRNQENVQ